MKKVLVVDDNPANVKLTAEALKYAGYEVLEADNGQDAINISEKEKPDLILLDIQMPGMDGLATIWKIRSLPGMENLPHNYVNTCRCRSNLFQTICSTLHCI